MNHKLVFISQLIESPSFKNKMATSTWFFNICSHFVHVNLRTSNSFDLLWSFEVSSIIDAKRNLKIVICCGFILTNYEVPIITPQVVIYNFYLVMSYIYVVNKNIITQLEEKNAHDYHYQTCNKSWWSSEFRRVRWRSKILLKGKQI